jgi:cell division protein FtsW
VLINMGVVLGLLPTKGLVLPFISYGGSSMMMTLAAMGVLMSLSRELRER